MKLQVEKTKNRLVEIPTYCCSRLKLAFDREVIGFGDIDEDLRTGDNSINIFKYDLRASEHVLYPIDFCPFCGSEIKIEFVKNVKLDF